MAEQGTHSAGPCSAGLSSRRPLRGVRGRPLRRPWLWLRRCWSLRPLSAATSMVEVVVHIDVFALVFICRRVRRRRQMPRRRRGLLLGCGSVSLPRSSHHQARGGDESLCSATRPVRESGHCKSTRVSVGASGVYPALRV